MGSQGARPRATSCTTEAQGPPSLDTTAAPPSGALSHRPRRADAAAGDRDGAWALRRPTAYHLPGP
eukprot:12004852-Alexandrium_andersonii.AAC.1